MIISNTVGDVVVELVEFSGRTLGNVDNIIMAGNLTNSNDILLNKGSDSNITKSVGGDLNITNSVGDVNVELVNFNGKNIWKVY